MEPPQLPDLKTFEFNEFLGVVRWPACPRREQVAQLKRVGPCKLVIFHTVESGMLLDNWVVEVGLPSGQKAFGGCAFQGKSERAQAFQVKIERLIRERMSGARDDADLKCRFKDLCVQLEEAASMQGLPFKWWCAAG